MIMGQASAVVVQADPHEPMHRQSTRVVDGRAPRTPSEVLITQALADRLKLGIGATIRADHGPLRIVGISQAPFCLSCDQVVTLPSGDADGTYLIQGLLPGP